MSKTRNSKLIVLFSVLAMITFIVTLAPASALISQSVSSWYLTSDTRVVSTALGDVNADGQAELVIAGYYNDGARWNAMVQVLNDSTLAAKNVAQWNFGSDTQIASVAIGDVNGDGVKEIVTAGNYFDGVNWNAMIHVFNVSTTSNAVILKNVGWWKFGNDTTLASVAIGDVNGDGVLDIVTAGAYFDGVNWNAMVHVFDASTTSTALVLKNVGWWKFGADTYINSVAVGNVTGSATLDIVTAGTYFNGVSKSAMLHVFGASTTSTALVIRNVGWWNWGGDTIISSVAIGNVTGGALNSIVTGGYYFDGVRTNSMLHVFGASTTSTGFNIQNVYWWFKTSNTQIKSVVIGNYSGSANLDIATLGTSNDGVRNNADLRDFNGATLATKSEATWFTTSDTEGNSAVIDVTPSGGRIITGGQFWDNTRAEAQVIVWA